MGNTLHITNGDGAGSLLKAANIEGDVLPWRDTMQSGPFPKGLSLEEHSKIRAEYFSGPAMPVSDVTRDFEIRDEHLKAFNNYEEVILWFEHDLLDQLQILQILQFFHGQDLKSTKLSLVCINEYEGIIPFRGLGQLSPEQIEALVPIKRPITKEHLKIANAGWQAFCEPDPTHLETYIQSDLSSLPFLKAALKRHLEEYPSLKNGLNKTQNKILELVRNGVTNPVQNFIEFMNYETVFFMGDWTHFREISRMCNGEQPLLSCSPNGKFLSPPDHEIDMKDFKSQTLSLTELGEKVMDGKRDAVELIKLDQWFGGVHLECTKPRWRWDEKTEKLLKTEAIA
ncbi:MAG: DUF1835 domain-containing protein [Hyphomicrobiales bacterium]